MIVRETEDSFVFVTQPDHANLAGHLAEHWKDAFFWKSARIEDVFFAIYQHDRAWVIADEQITWNEQSNKPYSFLDFPTAAKLEYYTNGIDEIEKNNAYAAILCSMHYASFMNVLVQKENDFFEQEKARQNRLRDKLHLYSRTNEDLLTYHFHMLQLLDRLSLYMCINHPGVSKHDEYSSFKDGFINSEEFSFTGHKQIIANWLSRHDVQVSPSPFAHEFNAAFLYRQVNKKLIHEKGIAAVYNKASLRHYAISVR